MQIAGEWWLCDDGVTRPVVRAAILDENGQAVSERFLVDSCADRTVLSAAILSRLHLPIQTSAAGCALQGISGHTAFVELATVLQFTSGDGIPIRMKGTFAAFTELSATDFSVLGRDVLNNFDVILSWRRREILLLAPNHQYQVLST